jgi:hypothetical protein
MAFAINVSPKDTGVFGDKFYAIGNMTVSGTYVGGGMTLDFGVQPLIKSSRKPDFVSVNSRAGYSYSYIPGTTAHDGKLLITQGGAAGAPEAEIPAATVPAGVSSDTLNFFAIFPGML